MERCSHQPRDAGPPGAGRGGKDLPAPPPEPLGGAQPCSHLDFRRPASRTGRGCISVVLRFPASGTAAPAHLHRCDHLLRQP